jgi:serine phosphatase RsbU (regulator of sigma subunit)
MRRPPRSSVIVDLRADGDIDGSPTVAGDPPPPASDALRRAAGRRAAASTGGERDAVLLGYLETLAAASRAISGTLDPDRVAETLLEKTAEILSVPAVSVMLLNERNEVRITASRGLSDGYAHSEGVMLEESIAARALAEGRTFASWDLRQAPDERAAQAAVAEGIVSVACAPMFFGARPVGALNVYCRAPRFFTEDQFYVLSLLAAHGAVALSNARAYRRLHAQSAEVQAGFHRVGAALSSSLDLGGTLRLIVQLAGEMTRAAGGAMYMLQGKEEGGGLLLSAARGLERRSIGRFRRQALDGVVREALDGRRVVVISDTRRRTDVAFPTLRSAGAGIQEVRSAVCVPVLAGDRQVGVLEQYAATPDAFSKADIRLLTSFAHQASVAIENARLYAQERGVAQTLQRAFLPDLPDGVPGFQIGRIYAPGSEVAAVGGDTYDVFPLPDGRIAALIADVSGQGTHAATLAVMAKYTVRAYALENPHPSSVLARVNDALVHQTGDSTFLTLFYALIEPDTRRVIIARAAHPPAILCRARTHVTEALDGTTGLIAGFLTGQEYDSHEIVLEPGDTLVFYTDGVTEARRRKAMFGEEKLKALIASKADLSAQEIATAVYTAIFDYTQGALNDDVALLVLKAE